MNAPRGDSCRHSQGFQRKLSRVHKLLANVGLRPRLLFAFFLVSLVPLIILFCIQYQIAKRSTLNIIETSLLQVADVQQRRLNLELQRLTEQLQLIASRTQMRISLEAFSRTRQQQDLDLLNRILADAVSSMDNIVGLWIRNEDELLVTGMYDEIAVVNTDVLPPVLGAGEPQLELDWSNYSLPYVWVSSVLTLEEQRIGSIHSLVTLDTLCAVVDDFPCDRAGGLTALLLHDTNNNMKMVGPFCPIRMDTTQGFYQTLEWRSFYEGVLAGDNAAVPTHYQDQIVIVRPLDHGIGHVVVHVSTECLTEAFWYQMRLVLLLSLFALLLVILMSFGLARMISQPLRQLAKASSSLHHGDTDVRIRERFWGEFTELTRSFNRAIRMLSQRTRELNREVEARRRSQQKLVDLANTDTLTGLINRRFFMEKLREILSSPGRERQPAALLYLDLDDFKPINDRMGHEAGDLVLQVVAGRIRHLLREGDLAARLGGDEFALLLMKNVGHPFDPQAVAQRVEEQLALPMTIKDQVVSVGCSVGVVSLVPGANPQEVLNRADQNMYRAKHARRGGAPGGT